MSNKTNHFSLILGLVAVVLLLGCGGPTEKPKNISAITKNQPFTAWQIVTVDEVPDSLREKCANACVKAMEASKNQVNGGADDQDLEDVVTEIRLTILPIYQKSNIYLILKKSPDDAWTYGLRMNVTGFTPTQIDSILNKYNVE